MDREKKLISFDVFRTLGIEHVRALKPEQMFACRDDLRQADWVLFPEEWQVNPLIHTLGCRIFPSVASYRFGQNKIEFTRAMWMVAPEHMPETLILPATSEAAEQVIDRFGFPFVVKIPRSSMGQGVFKIECRRDLEALLPELDVLYAQEMLPIDRDLRVVWIGDEVVAAYWRVSDDFHNNISRGGEADFSAIPNAAIALVQRLARGMGIDHAGFDLACVDGHWYAIEANVRFGNDALRAKGINTAKRIADWLDHCDPVQDGPETPDKPDGPMQPGRLATAC